MPDALDKIRGGAEKAWEKLAAQRLGRREFDVRVEDFIPGDDVLGTAGTFAPLFTISPRPAVAFRAIYDMTPDGLVQIGDVQVSKISRSLTPQQLRGPSAERANRWVIDGQHYEVVTLQSNAVEWIAALREID